MSVLNNTIVNGVVTQTMPASAPNHLVRLAEAQALVAAIFKGPWNGLTTYTAGQMTTDGGSTYTANQTTLNQQPSANPSVWQLAAAAGSNGSSSFSYIGYASDASGTGFSLTPATGLNYVAFLTSTTAIPSPTAANFTGLWQLFAGTTGATGPAGSAGAAGAAAYFYIAFASDTSGTNFSLTPGSSLNYVAFLSVTAPIVSPVAANFAGLWKNYANPFTVSGAITLASGVLGLNAASANTASYLVQRDASGNFSGSAIAGTTFVVGGTATLSIVSGALNVNTSITATALTLGALTGVLKASAGVVSGSATTDDLTEGSTNLYFTAARGLATPLTGLSSTNILLATDTVLAAFGKLDNVLGGNYAAGTVTGNFSISGNLTVSGVTTLATSLNGLLKTTNGVVSGSATTDNLTEGGNLYFTNARVDARITGTWLNLANGLCPLDSSGKVPLANLHTYGATAQGASSQTEMLALASTKQGDICLRSDTNIAYILANNTPSVPSSWYAWVYPVMSVNSATGAVVLTTDNVNEGSTNLYFTNARVDSRITGNWKGAANGLCPLDVNQLVPAANLPPVGNGIWIVSSQSTQTNLTTALKGDIANRTDENLSYVLSNNTPTSYGSWLPLLYPVSSVNGVTGTVVLTTSDLTEGSNLYFTNARAIAAPLTGYTSGAGTISSADTVLSAIQKLNGNVGAIVLANYVALAGGTLTGTLNFSGTSNRGLVVNQLSTTQINSLAATATYFGNVVYDTTLNQLKALVNGAWVSLAAGASLPLAAGGGSPLTGTLYFQDGLSSNIAFGSTWSHRTSGSNANFDILNGGTVALTVNSSNLVSAPNGSFTTPNGYDLTISGTPTAVLYLSSGQPLLNLGGSFQITATSGYSGLQLGYGGGGGLTIDASNNVSCSAELHLGSTKVIDGSHYFYDNAGHQILAGQQAHFALPSLTGTYASDYSNLSTWMSAIQSVLQTHGLMAAS